MNLDQIATAITVLDELSACFTMMPANDSDATKAGWAVVTAQGILVEYAAHRTDGYSHQEALRLTAAKQQSLSEASASLHALLTKQVE